MKFFERRRLINAMLFVSVAFNVAIVGYLARSGGLRRIFVKLDVVDALKSRQQFQKDLEAKYRKFPDSPEDVIFAGDSLVGDGPWSELFGKLHNRGIGGDTSANLLDRLGEITEGKPKRVFFLVGTNDLAAAIPDSQYLRNYRAILERTRKESPSTAITVISVFPVNPTFPQPPTYDNARVVETNRRLRELIAEVPGVKFVDVTPLLVDSVGDLRREYSTDGMHLTVDGYLAIREALKASVSEEPSRP